jgi:pimeloyl-ACP methyl ester carboxylesterase
MYARVAFGDDRTMASRLDVDKGVVMTPTESDVRLDIGVLRVRQAGDPQGYPVVYFHGTPGSRLDLSFGDDMAMDQHVRLVSFDRPGYGGSTPAPFSLSSLAHDTQVIADSAGLGGFATLGQSGGGPFALAAATVGGGRVTRVGVASGAGPFELVPGALDSLDEIDREARTHLPSDPERAARGFGAGFEKLEHLLRDGDDRAVTAAFESRMSQRDRTLMDDAVIGPSLIASMREGLRKGVQGGAWDNVAWVGAWDIDLGQVRCPVLLWYGEEDLFAPPAHGEWLKQNLENAHLVRRDSEGHFGLVDHLAEVLAALAEPFA